MQNWAALLTLRTSRKEVTKNHLLAESGRTSPARAGAYEWPEIKEKEKKGEGKQPFEMHAVRVTDPLGIPLALGF